MTKYTQYEQTKEMNETIKDRLMDGWSVTLILSASILVLPINILAFSILLG